MRLSTSKKSWSDGPRNPITQVGIPEAAGPTSSTQLRSLLTAVRARGYAVEHGTVTPDLGSVAAAALDHAGYPSAAFAITYEERLVAPVEEAALAEAVVAAANALSRRIGGTRMRA